jgi:hypothetical protein
VGLDSAFMIAEQIVQRGGLQDQTGYPLFFRKQAGFAPIMAKVNQPHRDFRKYCSIVEHSDFDFKATVDFLQFF